MRIFSEDIRMEIGIEKCAMLIKKKKGTSERNSTFYKFLTFNSQKNYKENFIIF